MCRLFLPPPLDHSNCYHFHGVWYYQPSTDDFKYRSHHIFMEWALCKHYTIYTGHSSVLTFWCPGRVVATQDTKQQRLYLHFPLVHLSSLVHLWLADHRLWVAACMHIIRQSSVLAIQVNVYIQQDSHKSVLYDQFQWMHTPTPIEAQKGTFTSESLACLPVKMRDPAVKDFGGQWLECV